MYFKVIVNLNSFFCDHRRIARVFINKSFKTVEDLENRITEIFGIENFVLLVQNEFLPSCEDIRILENNDVVNVVRKSTNLNYIQEMPVDLGIKKKIKKSKKVRLELEELPTKKSKKRKKDKEMVEYSKEVNEPINSSPEKENKVVENNAFDSDIPKIVEPADANQSRSSTPNNFNYKKEPFLKPSVDLFLQHPKINIIKIDVVKDCVETEQHQHDLTSITDLVIEEPTLQNGTIKPETSLHINESLSILPNNAKPTNSLNNENSLSQVNGKTPNGFPNSSKSSGIGELLQKLRSDYSTVDSESNSACEFITTRRKRRRVRKRKAPKKDDFETETDISMQDPSAVEMKPLNTIAQPSMHIKFTNDEENDARLEELLKIKANIAQEIEILNESKMSSGNFCVND